MEARMNVRSGAGQQKSMSVSEGGTGKYDSTRIVNRISEYGHVVPKASPPLSALIQWHHWEALLNWPFPSVSFSFTWRGVLTLRWKERALCKAQGSFTAWPSTAMGYSPRQVQMNPVCKIARVSEDSAMFVESRT